MSNPAVRCNERIANLRKSPVTIEAGRQLRESIEGPSGYASGLRLEVDELRRVRELIAEQWLKQLQRRAPEQSAMYAQLGMARYHEMPRSDHAKIWPKQARILPSAAVSELRKMSVFQRLEAAWGEFSISDEDEVGWEEVYWRLVRPHETSDVGPLHADAWFWELGHGIMPRNVARVKVWIAIHCEPGLSGLRVVPGSHRQTWRYHGAERSGMIKPQIDEDERALNAILVPTEPGETIVFHDRLLHGGAVNRGRETRVSIEFTMFVPTVAGICA